MKLKRLLCTLMALAMLWCRLPSVVAESNSEWTVPEGLDISKQVELVIYMLGDEKVGQREMTDNFNKIAMEKLNCTVKINFISFAEWGTKYPLLFSSGEEFDIAYAATWMNYYAMAQKGAFMPLEELFPKYAPNTYARTSETALRQATVSDHLYAVPTLLATYSGYGPLYRLDLVENLDEWTGKMETFEDIEAYLALVKANYPEIEPFYVYSSGSELDDMYLTYNRMMASKNAVNDFLYFDTTAENPKLVTLYEWEKTPDFLQMVKRWNENGYFPKSALSDTDADKQKFGKVGLRFHNLDNYTDYVMTYTDYKWGYSNINPDVCNKSFTQDCMVIPNTSKNPERALALWDLITNDEEAFRAFYYGIEGVSYNIIEEDGIEYVEAVDQEIYHFSNMYSARTSEFNLPNYGYPADAMALKKAYDEHIQDGVGMQKYASFIIDTTGIETEYAACQNVHQQYWWPLEVAYVDVEEGLKEYQEKMEAAGIEKVRAELQRQLDEYCASFQ